MKYYIFEINASKNPDIKEVFAFEDDTPTEDIAKEFEKWEQDVVIGNNSNEFRLATKEEVVKHGNGIDFSDTDEFADED